MADNWLNARSKLNQFKAVKVWTAQSKLKTRLRRFDADKTRFLQFQIPREDDSDVYKQNSPSALRQLITTPQRSVHLELDDMELIDHVASDLDRSMSVEEIVGAPTRPTIPQKVMDEMERLPSWLYSMVTAKYPAIHNHYGENTVLFIRAVADRIDRKYRAQLRTRGNEDTFVVREEGDPSACVGQLGQLNHYGATKEELMIAADREMEKRSKSKIVEPLTHSNMNNGWGTSFVSRANLKLRAALKTRAAYADLATVAEDEELSKVDQKEIDSDDDDNNVMDYSFEIFDPEETMKYAESKVEKETGFKKLTTKENEQRQLDKEMNKNKKKCCLSWNRKIKMNREKHVKRKSYCSHIFVSKKEKRRNKRIFLMKRGYFRNHDQLFHNNCGSFQKSPVRMDRSGRIDDSFHNYCVALVASTWFKWMILVIISLNALMLLIETSIVEDYSFYFEILDHIFVAMYLIEFVIKFYAHPYRYWRSGFNLFDFVILISSLVKTIMDWTDVADLNVLRVLLIIRALRVLRGISLSVQLQVLVSALVHTIKTHALGIVILLVILLYLVSIIAYFLFGHLVPFGTVGQGMLTLIVFMTIDGWTGIHEQLASAGGTVFSVICIILGNFLFSNIFVAIIITNISSATDVQKEKQNEQRQRVLRIKKEKVFHRQKLDLHQLFARQRTSAFTDFFSLGQEFQKLLRHDDFVAMTDVVNSPLWIDSVYQSTIRSVHTSNIALNLHREMADNLMEQFRLFGETKMDSKPIRRGRYNRYMSVKGKLALIKQEILNSRKSKGEGIRDNKTNTIHDRDDSNDHQTEFLEI